MNEKYNILFFDIINILIWILLFLIIFLLLKKDNINETMLLTINVIIILLIISILILLLIAIMNMNDLKYDDYELLNKSFIFSTKLLNDDVNLMTYPQKSILNLNKINGIYNINSNHIINYNNISNNYYFKINNINYISKLYNINIEDFNKNYINYKKYYDEIGLKYDDINKIYSFNEKNIIKYIVINFNNKWLLLENENNNYIPLYCLYYSYIYSYYRLCDTNNNCIFKFNTIGPENLHDLSINRYYTIYGNYKDKLGFDISDNKYLNYLKLLLSLLLPLTFTTKLKINNYNNNFK